MASEKQPRFYVLLHNLSKPRNLGMVVRSAAAFNAEKIVLVAKGLRSKKRTKLMTDFGLLFGDKGCAKRMSYEVYPSLAAAKQAFIIQGLSVCGVEITSSSAAVQSHPFRGDTVFVLGNEGDGLIDAVKQICDYFVYIQQYSDHTASLNVAVSASIVFHHFALWAEYPVTAIHGEKFRDSGTTTPRHPDFHLHIDPSPPSEESDVSCLFSLSDP